MTLLGACALIGISPFAVFRLVNGQFAAAAVDFAILACIMAAVGYAHVSRRTRCAGVVLASIACGGGVIVAMMQGDNGVFWIYPAILAAFFMAGSRAAGVISIITALALTAQPAIYDSFAQQAAHVATVLMVSACAYIFARRSDHQQRVLEQFAILDPLTGVRNRRAMDVALRQVVARSRSSAQHYALVILDLDHFKCVNDTHGHAAGDEVLIACARVLGDGIRGTDRIYRYGGEEFVIVLHGVECRRLHVLLGDLCTRVHTRVRSPAGPVTVSLGAALLLADESMDDWLNRADSALYRAKNSGRNRFVIAADNELQLAVNSAA